MGTTEPHPAIEPIAFLLGTWRGMGKGVYPTIDDFTYGEEIRFWHFGRPLIAYTQRTWSLDNETPMHSEMGFWRPQRDGSIEIVLTHTFGAVEIQEGRIEGARIVTESRTVASTTSAKEVTQIARTYEMEGTSLRYQVAMAAVEQPLQGHLEATLTRVG